MWIAERRVQHIYRGKRKFRTFSASSSSRSDWLCNSSIKLAVLKSIATKLQPKSIKILIPGIGHSTLGRTLLDEGYDVKVCDLDESQVSSSNRELNPFFFDLLGPVPKEFVGAFDWVVDSSVTDVFMQLTKGTAPNTVIAKQVYKKLLSMLRPGGVIVTFSMNNQAWRSMHSIIPRHRMHMVLRPTLYLTTTRGRNTNKVGEDVLVLVASAQPLLLKGGLGALKEIGAAVTDWSDDLPEDWRSQRP